VKASHDRPLVFIHYGEGVARRSLAGLLARDAARRTGQHCRAVRAIAESLICLTKILSSHRSLSFFRWNLV
jgi:hypothetical protein